MTLGPPRLPRMISSSQDPLLNHALASVAQLVRVLSRKLKGHGFDSWSGHIALL